MCVDYSSGVCKWQVFQYKGELCRPCYGDR